MLQWNIISKPKLIALNETDLRAWRQKLACNNTRKGQQNQSLLSHSPLLILFLTHTHTEVLSNNAYLPLYFMLLKACFLILILFKNVLVEHSSIQHNIPVSHRECGWQAFWGIIVQQVPGTNWLIQEVISRLKLDWFFPRHRILLPNCLCLSWLTSLWHSALPRASCWVPLRNSSLMEPFKILIEKCFLMATEKDKRKYSHPPSLILTACLSLFFIQISRAL